MAFTETPAFNRTPAVVICVATAAKSCARFVWGRAFQAACPISSADCARVSVARYVPVVPPLLLLDDPDVPPLEPPLGPPLEEELDELPELDEPLEEELELGELPDDEPLLDVEPELEDELVMPPLEEFEVSGAIGWLFPPPHAAIDIVTVNSALSFSRSWPPGRPSPEPQITLVALTTRRTARAGQLKSRESSDSTLTSLGQCGTKGPLWLVRRKPRNFCVSSGEVFYLDHCRRP
jgi:hypothetical protein